MDLNIELFEKQREFVLSDKPFAAFIGGVGSGKTQGGAYKMLLYMLNNPGVLGMVTSPVYWMLRDSTLRTVLEIFPKELYKYHKVENRLELANGSEALFRSTDEAEHLRGPNLGFVWMDEAALSISDSFKILQGRLRQEGMPHQLWVTTTPKGFNWVYQEFAKEEREDYFIVTCSAKENPFLPTDYIKRLEGSYKGEFALQEIEGQFTVVGGNAFFATDALSALLDGCVEPRETSLGGLLRAWKPPVVAGRYVAFGDVAWGQKSAYSCVALADWQTGEQVAELYGRPKLDELAYHTVELCEKYNNAFVGIECNGEGQTVVDKMVELGYGKHMYARDRDKEGNDKYGWLTGSGTRPVMLAELEEAVHNLSIRPMCKDAISEMMSFVRDEKGHPGPSPNAYADHVMAWAGLWQMRKYAKYRIGNREGRVGRLAVEESGIERGQPVAAGRLATMR